MVSASSDRPGDEGGVEKTLKQLATLRHRPILCLDHAQRFQELDEACVGEVRKILPMLAPFKEVGILIDSPGGDIECARRIIRMIRRHATHVEVLVPNWAKSAATFFCLGANQIYIGPDGELGPLDPQQNDPTGGSRPISSLETFKALEQLRTYSLETLDAIIQLLVQMAHMDVPYALDHAQPLFSAIVMPLYQQVDPHELGESSRYLAMSEEYSMRVMTRWSYPDINDDVRRHIVRRLVWDYPTHGFVIDLDEAQELGLNAGELDEESDSLCKRVLEEVNGYIGIALPEIEPVEDSKDDERPVAYTGEKDEEKENERDKGKAATGGEVVAAKPD